MGNEGTSSEKLLVTPQEVARRLQISRTKVYDLIAKKRLPAVKLGPRCTRIPIEAMERWVHEQVA